MTAAYEHNGHPIGSEAFYAIACDPRRSVAVEACAGAGKTWMLVSRILRALLEGMDEQGHLSVQPQHILAITFTKKAAGEMRSRLTQWLIEFSHADQAKLAEELHSRGVALANIPALQRALPGLYEAVLHTGRLVQIRTFHSWFAALLRTAPLAVLQAMGLPTQYELLEDDAPAEREVWPRFFERLATQPEMSQKRSDALGMVVPGAEAQNLDEQDEGGEVDSSNAHANLREDFLALVAEYGRHQTQKALHEALQRRVEFDLADQQGVATHSVPPFWEFFPEYHALRTPAACLSQALNEPGKFQILWGAANALGASKAPTFSQKGMALEQALTEKNVDQLLTALLTKDLTPRVFGKKITDIETVRQAQNWAMELLMVIAQHKAWVFHQRLTGLTRLLLTEFAAVKRDRGWVDMNDIERAAQVMLSDPELSGWVQERLDVRVRHLLIDEFQDTNPLQWQALYAWLSGYAGAGGVPPSVFIVGDPKQSIYRFRRAEPQVFRAAQDFVVQALGGDLLSCDHSRRNAPAVLDAVNGVMAQAQAQQMWQGFRHHTTASSAQGNVMHLAAIARDEKSQVNQVNQVSGEESEDLVNVIPDQQPAPHWRNSLTTPRTAPEESLRQHESQQAALWVARQIQNGIPPKEIMVLARKRDRLNAMQEALRELHIPALQPEKLKLVDAAEVQDLLALMDALVSPGHDLSLAQALKSPLFDIQDEDLVALVLLRDAQAASALSVPMDELEWQRDASETWDESDIDEHMGDDEDSPNQATRRAIRQSSIAPALSTLSWLELLQNGDLIHQLPHALKPVGQILSRWQAWLKTLPPHDALAAIYHDGDVLARFAAAAPVTLQDSVLVNLRALLKAALQAGAVGAGAEGGGRYATPYALIRALKNGSVKMPARALPEAVSLLTIHGAKGLEAHSVLLLDTDASAPKSKNMSVLISWPGERQAPDSFVFLTSESKPPPSVADLLQKELQEREREELNALYVAMTRAKQQLVISSVAPARSLEGSWWQRILPSSHAMDFADQGVKPCQSEANIKMKNAIDSPSSTSFSMAVVPELPDALKQGHSTARTFTAVVDALDNDASRIGQAMHLLLESDLTPPLDVLSFSTVAQRFKLSPEQMQVAMQTALAIRQGQGAWAWDSSQIDWHANEVEITHNGAKLRLDRLVRHSATGQWWVFDHKSNTQPQTQPELLAQLTTYRQAVQALQPTEVVRAAFLTATGELIEID